LLIDVKGASVANIPYNYQDRVRKSKISELVNLTIAVPNKYDVKAIAGIHEYHPLTLGTLVKRFESKLLSIAPITRNLIQRSRLRPTSTTAVASSSDAPEIVQPLTTQEHDPETQQDYNPEAVFLHHSLATLLK
jgi:hypothetical protein